MHSDLIHMPNGSTGTVPKSKVLITQNSIICHEYRENAKRS